MIRTHIEKVADAALEHAENRAHALHAARTCHFNATRRENLAIAANCEQSIIDLSRGLQHSLARNQSAKTEA
jgi:hypothetical protein